MNTTRQYGTKLMTRFALSHAICMLGALGGPFVLTTTLLAADVNSAGHAELAFDFDSPSPLETHLSGAETAQVFGDVRIVDFDSEKDADVGQNRALEIDKPGSYVRIGDPGDASPLDFDVGDKITISAAVQLSAIKDGANLYLIGKGRTYETGPKENHNYALRLTGASGNRAKISFLFSTTNPQGNKLQYHRWTSKQSFAANEKWHDLTVSYIYGVADSLQGEIDGQIVDGDWDMAGATGLPPTIDNDSVWIGSARAGDPANSFTGRLDNISIQRLKLSQEELADLRRVKPPLWPSNVDPGSVTVSLFESLPGYTSFSKSAPEEAFRFTIPSMALHRLPLKYLDGGIRDHWQGPLLVRLYSEVSLPTGKLELLIRAPGLSRLWIGDAEVLSTKAKRMNPDAHQPFIVYDVDVPWLRPPHVGDHESRVQFNSPGGSQRVVFELIAGSKDHRCEVGESLVAFRFENQQFAILSPSKISPWPLLVDAEFESMRKTLDAQLDHLDRQLLLETSQLEDRFWESRHELARNLISSLPELAVVEKLPSSDGASAVIDHLLWSEAVENCDARQRQVLDNMTSSELNNELFYRRASLDSRGVPPSLEELKTLQTTASSKEVQRAKAIDLFLEDDRWADHWTSYWQDKLAENPNILKPSLNNTGPFRYWIHDSLLINKPMDRFVTELIRMQGSRYAGGPAGFEMATENDVPAAEKAHVIASAFMATNMKCARCHDAPYHPWTQRDLFSLGAMLSQSPIKVPATSSVPKEFFERKGNDSAIEVTLFPDEIVEPGWPSLPFQDADCGPTTLNGQYLEDDRIAGSSREQLAAMLTRAENQRFAKVIVNRVWTRMFGWGLVNSTDDWYEADFDHPQLLSFLAKEFVLSGYDLKQLVRIIMNSQSYQRQAIDETSVDRALAHIAPWQRRMSAEQIVDSLHQVVGVPLQTEPLTFDPESTQQMKNFLNLGAATRAWELTSLANERDRPSLSLPRAAAVCECLEAFGWNAARPAPIAHREAEANMVGPGVLANGSMTGWITRMTEESSLTKLALEASDVGDFVDELFLMLLNRSPTQGEQAVFVETLAPGFDARVETPRDTEVQPPVHRGFVTWSNHFDVQANTLMREIEHEVAAGPVPTQRISANWRERAEDAAWAILNAPEFILIP
ncbi:MAG: DUF1553 domain-containing protein [Planctomycetales bacterium]|nr:DUF1553 domain-containing protein [Planctomycetales bacterium]